MSNRSAARGRAAASSIRLTLRTSNAVATSSASPSRCFLFCDGSRAARSARTAAATVSTPPIPQLRQIKGGDLQSHQDSRVQEFLMGGERYKLTGDGKRQIFSFHIPGDIPDLQSLHLDVMDHSLASLTAT